MKRTTLAALTAALTLVPLGLVACGGDDDEAAAPAATTAEMEMDTHSDTGGDGEAVSIESPAVDLRVAVDRLLAEHAGLATFAMQKGFAGEKDFEAIAAALEGNTVDLGEAIGSVYGEEGKTNFLQLWRDHIGFFVDYTVATAKKDEAGQKQAREQLGEYQADFSAFLDTATGGNLPQSGAAEALQAHVTQLIAALDTYAAGDYTKAYEQIREAYHHMFMTGDALSGAIVEQKPDAFTLAPATQASSDLRVALGRLLGEHAGLATFAMQKGFAGEKDFEAIAAALEGNTVDLGEAIGSVYGEEGKTNFLQLWRDHIGFFVDYTVATAKKDEAGQKQAREQLGEYQADFSAFLDTATGGNLPQSGAAEALQAHVTQLIAALDTYAAGDYTKAYEQIREAYAHMYMTADALAGAIVAQKPDAFGS
jgi:hypothetical protein